MLRKKNPDKALLEPHWTLPHRTVSVFRASDTTVVGISPAEIVVIDDEQPRVRMAWTELVSARWDSDEETLELMKMGQMGKAIVIKCTQSPSDMFMHMLREGIEQAHVVSSHHQTASGVDVQLWIVKDYRGTLEYREYIDGTLPPEEVKDVNAMRYKIKDSVGLVD